MNKIRLDLAELKVESFVTSDTEREGEGTVFAMANTVCDATCNGGETCDGGHGCSGSDGGCPDYTDPELLSCTGGGDPTQLGCDTGDCPTELDCSEEATACGGPTD